MAQDGHTHSGPFVVGRKVPYCKATITNLAVADQVPWVDFDIYFYFLILMKTLYLRYVLPPQKNLQQVPFPASTCDYTVQCLRQLWHGSCTPSSLHACPPSAIPIIVKFECMWNSCSSVDETN